MRRTALLLTFWLPGVAVAEVRPGDVVFQTSTSAQSEVIAEVTRSAWTHVGVVLERDRTLMVLEAVSPVRWTPFSVWRARGVGSRLLVRRLDRPLSVAELARLVAVGERLLGRPYDARFEWGDERLYCSELVQLLFERALGVRLVEPQRWRDLALSPRARALARRRIGHLPPPDASIVTPAALAETSRLITVPRRTVR